MNRRRLHLSLSTAAALALGLALRLWFIFHAARIAGDTLVYGDIAKNWLQHGIYGFTQTASLPHPTLIRLPGYPLFLVLCFTLFGVEHYTAVMLLQSLIDLATCLILSRLALHLFGPRTARITLWIAALCPFTASYVAAPLTETLSLTCIALAFFAIQRWQACGLGFNRWLAVLAAALAYAILLRPEQGLLSAAIFPAMFWIVWSTQPCTSQPHTKSLRPFAPLLVAAFATLLPLVPWTARNWSTFHVLQPLAPRYATDPGEFVPLGFQHWFRTWGIDFASTDDVYWNYDGAPIDIADIPSRAFDSQAQYARTAELFDEYNLTDNATPAFDARFQALARQRIRANPIRYYLALPVARLLNMGFRPRTEMLPVALDWWNWRDHPSQSAFSLAFALLNLAYFVFAALGFHRWRRQRPAGLPPLAWAMIASIALRAALLLTLDNSEPRYTLEFFPILILAAALALSRQPLPTID